MSEDPIKLFATRGERYPESSDADRAHSAIEKIIDQLPIAGPITAFVLSQFLAPPLERRRANWLKELADAVEQLEAKGSINIEDLARNEMFVSAVIQATRAAISTHQGAKLEALRNAVLNIALSKSMDEEKYIVFLNLIELFSETHLELLKLFSNRAVYPIARMGELRARRALTDPMVLDLNDRGLLVDPRPYVARTRESHDSLTIQGWTLSPLGNEFLSFIASPSN